MQKGKSEKNGYNCAQTVACAYCDLTGIDEEKAGIVYAKACMRTGETCYTV